MDIAESVSKSQDRFQRAESRPMPRLPLRPYLAILQDSNYTMSWFRRSESGPALAVLAKDCCQPIIPGWLDSQFPEYLACWRSLPIGRVLMSPCWRTTACRCRSGLTLSNGAVWPGFQTEIRPVTQGSAEICRLQRANCANRTRRMSR